MTQPVAPVAGVPTFDPVTSQLPGYALQQLQAQRRMQIAQALTQQGMAPIDYDPRGRISWAQGLAKALSAFTGSQQFNKAAQQEADLQQQGAQAWNKALGGTPPQQPLPSSGSPSPQALAAALDPASAALSLGAQQGSVGPTVANAQLMDAMPPSPPPVPQAPPAAPASAPTPSPSLGTVSPTPLNPYGAPPLLIMRASQGDPAAQEELKTFLANKALTPEQRNAQDPTIGSLTVDNLRSQNWTPMQKLIAARSLVGNGTPQAQELDAAISKENYQAPIEVKAGNLTMTPDGKTPLAYNPGLDKGINPTWTTDANGYTTATGATPVRGYGPALGSIVSADQRARSANQVTIVKSAGGRQVPAWAGPAADVGSAQLGLPSSTIPPNVQSGRDQEALQIAQTELDNTPEGPDRDQLVATIARLKAGGSPVPSNLGAPGGPKVIPQTLGQSTADVSVQKASADPIAQAPQMIQQSKSAVGGLESALRALDTVKATGPGTAKTNDVLAAVNNALGNAGINVGASGVNSYQALQKYLSNSLNAAASGTGASGSDARFDSFMHGQPNADTMNKPALQGAIRYVLSQHDANIAKGQFLTQAYRQASAQGDPNAAMTAQSQWANVYNPQVFAFNRMSPADRQAFKSSLSPQQQQQFGAQYNAAASRGWVQ